MISGLVLAGCGDAPTPPSLPPLAELELLAPGTSSGSGSCVRRGDDPEQSITAQVSVKNFTLRPPLACTEPECGTVLFTLAQGGREWTVESAQRFTSIATNDLPDGNYRITAELRNTFGKVYKRRDAKKAKCTTCKRSFQLDATCGEVGPEPAPPPESSDASTPLPNDAGAPEGRDAAAATDDAGSPSTDVGSAGDGGSSPGKDAGAPLDSGTSAALGSVDAAATPAAPDAGSNDAGPGPNPEIPDAGTSPDASSDAG